MVPVLVGCWSDLPCNVVVREEQDSTVTVAFMDRVVVLTDNPEIGKLAGEVRTRLKRVRDKLGTRGSG